MKKVFQVAVIILVLSMLAACTQTTSAPTTEPVATDAPLTAQEQWLKDNLLGKYDTVPRGLGSH